jgi:methyl-accepting chemotaxis protein
VGRGEADTHRVRASLTVKFVIGSLVVAGATSVVPDLARGLGIEFSTWGAFFVALGVGGGIGFFLSRMLGVKFDELRGATERIREGDLSVEIRGGAHAQLSDEIDDLAVSLAGMLERLRELVARVQSTAHSVSDSSTGLEDALDSLRRSSEGISSTVSQLGTGVDQEQELLGQASHQMHEISSEIDLNAGRAREAFGFAAEANQKAGTGVEVARLAIEKMKAVFERVEGTGDKLSLNASIEAARAGEAGRGFSVVADEIRKLSESAGRSADEISQLMHEIQADTAMVADEMRQSSQVIGEGREDVNTIASALGQISTAVSEAAQRAEEIFHGADSHSLNAQGMVSAIEEIAKVAGGNGRSINEFNETVRGQLRTLDEIFASAEALAGLASELERSLTIFRTEGAAATSLAPVAPAVKAPVLDTQVDSPDGQPIDVKERKHTDVTVGRGPVDGDVW